MTLRRQVELWLESLAEQAPDPMDVSTLQSADLSSLSETKALCNSKQPGLRKALT